MPRVGSGGRATAVVKSHYPKNLIFISRQDCVGCINAGARLNRHPWQASVSTSSSCPDRGFFTLLPLKFATAPFWGFFIWSIVDALDTQGRRLGAQI